MGLFGLARQIFVAIKDDPAAQATVRSERASLALELATDDSAGMDITSATVAGDTYSGQRSMTKRQRLLVLGQLCEMLDAQAAISSTTSYVHPGEQYGNGNS